jgi:hypothetical protein
MDPLTAPRQFVVPPMGKPGDRVPVVSPSWASPPVFPPVHEIGVRVLREELGLVPVEFSTTRKLGAPPRNGLWI